jgi:hypothetical protein
MSLTKEQSEKLEQKITGLLEKGYVSNPQPADRTGFDMAYAVSAAHEISEMIQTDYFLDDKEEFKEPLIDERVRVLREELAKPMNGLAGLFSAAGFGGGLGARI